MGLIVEVVEALRKEEKGDGWMDGWREGGREGERQECVGRSVHHHRPYTWPLIIKSIDPLILLD